MAGETTIGGKLLAAAKETRPGSYGALITTAAGAYAAWQVLGPFVTSAWEWLHSKNGQDFSLFITHWTGAHPNATARIAVFVFGILPLCFLLKLLVVGYIKGRWPTRDDRPGWARGLMGAFAPSDHATWAYAENKAIKAAVATAAADDPLSLKAAEPKQP